MRKLVLAVAVLSVMMLTVGSVAAADSPQGPRCTMGEALSNFEAPFQHFVSDDPSIRFKCQYRLFFDGGSFTYCEDDLILGGVNLFIDYGAEGWSRQEGIAYLESVGTRVWLDGIEQPLMRTAYKDDKRPSGAQVVYQHRAFITELPVGNHLSYFEETEDGEVVFTASVELHILPRTDALCS